MNTPAIHSHSTARRGVGALAFICLLVLAGVYGFEAPLLPALVVQGLQMALIAAYALEPMESHKGQRRGRLILLMVTAVVLAALGGSGQHVLLTLTIYIILVQLGSCVRHVERAFHQATSNPQRIRVLVGMYFAMIFIGGGLLSLPRAVTPALRFESGHYAARLILDCVFTAASATSLTGLTVLDAGQDFTLFGRIVLLALMQVGTWSILTLGAVAILRLTPAVNPEPRTAVPTLRRVFLGVVIWSLTLELLTAFGLYGLWPADWNDTTRWFWSLFHGVSAFSNTGMTLTPDSFSGYPGRWQLYAIVIPSVVAGGWGWPVLSDLARRVCRRLPSGTRQEAKSLGLGGFTRAVLCVTVVLMVLPILLVAVLQRGPGFEDTELTFGQRLCAAIFHTATVRSAGFNSTPLSVEHTDPVTWLILGLLMIIGGTPGSAAGGAGNMTIVVLAWALLVRLRPNSRKTVPGILIRLAVRLIAAMLGMIALTSAALLATESASPAEVAAAATSACTTAGLNTGLAPRLSIAGRGILIVAMVAGRLTPLILILFAAGRLERSEHSSEQRQADMLT